MNNESVWPLVNVKIHQSSSGTMFQNLNRKIGQIEIVQPPFKVRYFSAFKNFTTPM